MYPVLCNAASTDLELVLYYSNKLVWEKHVTNVNGCRIYYGDGDAVTQIESLPINLLEAVSFSQSQTTNSLSCMLIGQYMITCVVPCAVK